MGLSTFKTSINQASERLKTKIVLALDLTDRDRTTLSTRCIDILEAASPYICALKLNRPLVLRLCLDREIKDLLERAHDLGLVTIMDAKLNDVAHTNLATAVQYFDAGFDALIASPFVGWEG
jgi:orotidine-5'-phosphate decarboxylase